MDERTPHMWKGSGPSTFIARQPREALTAGGTDVSSQMIESSSAVRVTETKPWAGSHDGAFSSGPRRLMANRPGRRSRVSQRKGTTKSLPRAAARKDGRDRAEEDLGVERKAPVVDVGEVQRHPFLEARDVVPARDLPEAGHAGLHREPAPLPALVARHLVGKRRPRADERHLALQDVPELRHLVERE